MRAAWLGATHWHTPWLLDVLMSRGIRVASVWDPDPAAAQLFARTVEATTALTPKAALDAPGVDVAILTTRPVDSPEALAAAVCSEIPVIAEKPLGLRSDLFAHVVDDAERRGVFATVLFVNRLSPIWFTDATHEPRFARFRLNNGPAVRYARWGSPWMLDSAQCGGGALRNLGIHGADAILRLASDREDPRIIASIVRGDAGPGVDTLATALIEIGTCLTSLEAGYMMPNDDDVEFEFRVVGVADSVVDWGDRWAHVTAGHLLEERLEGIASRYKLYIADALDRLAETRAPLAGLVDCYRAARLVDQIYGMAGWLLRE